MITLGSLFDGIGGFPLAGIRNGITTLWASEIEPFPIRVTEIRFPNMKHLGDITKINGAEIEPVDIITFGSPCQDLSVAGKRAGLAGERSGLFMEAIRIIREMREYEKLSGRTDKHIRPRFAVWENVPGAFSSNKGEDFRAVLEETARVTDKTVVIPKPPRGGKWTTSGVIMGDGWSIAWRVLDAQFWGVPQRRRRIFLVADFGGQSAPEILFKRKGLSRHLAESREAREGTASNVEGGAGETITVDFGRTADRITINPKVSVTIQGEGGGCGAKTGLYCMATKQISQNIGIDKACPIMANDYKEPELVVYGISAYESNSMKSSNPHSGVYEAKTSRTLDQNGGSPACNQGGMAIVQCAGFRHKAGAAAGNIGFEMDVAPTLQADQQMAVCAGFNGYKSVTGSIQYQEDKAATLEANMPWNVINCQPSGISGTVSSKWAKGTGGPAGDEHYNLVINEVANPLSAQPQMRYRLDMDNVVCSVDCRNMYENLEKSATLQSKPNGGQSLNYQNPVRVGYTVRRLTPLECERLQNYPDFWTDIPGTTEVSSVELEFWREAWLTWDKVQSEKPEEVRPRRDNALLKWLKNPTSDSAQYKALGNSVAVVCPEYVLEGIKEVFERGQIS